MVELKQTPRQIVSELDQYIVGQQAAKKSVDDWANGCW